jgi:hypothetical protein
MLVQRDHGPLANNGLDTLRWDLAGSRCRRARVHSGVRRRKRRGGCHRRRCRPRCRDCERRGVGRQRGRLFGDGRSKRDCRKPRSRIRRRRRCRRFRDPAVRRRFVRSISDLSVSTVPVCIGGRNLPTAVVPFPGSRGRHIRLFGRRCAPQLQRRQLPHPEHLQSSLLRQLRLRAYRCGRLLPRARPTVHVILAS